MELAKEGVAAAESDFTAVGNEAPLMPNEDETTHKSNTLQAAFNIYKLFVALGILYFPFLFVKTGWLLAMIVIVLIGIFSYYCVALLLRVADDYSIPNISLSRLGREVIGEKMEKFINICIFGCQVACVINYVCFLRDFLHEVMCTARIDSLCSSEFFPLITTLIIVSPLSLVTNFHYFYVISAISTLIQFGAFIVLSEVNVSTLLQRTESIPFFENAFNFDGLSATIGNFIFAFEGIAVLMELRSSMKRPKTLTSILASVMSFVAVLYMVFPFIGYATFGEKIKQILLFNYDLASPKFFVIALLYALIILFTFPLQFFPILEFFPMRKNLLFRFVLMLSFGIGAYFFNDIQKTANLFGALFAGPISFIIPIVIYNSHFSKEISKARKAFNFLLLLVAFALCLFGIKGAAMELIHP